MRDCELGYLVIGFNMLFFLFGLGEGNGVMTCFYFRFSPVREWSGSASRVDALYNWGSHGLPKEAVIPGKRRI